jgi:hypothetical protein
VNRPRTRRGVDEHAAFVKVSYSDDSGIELLELFRKCHEVDVWFLLKDNLVGLEYDNEDSLWYLNHRVAVPAGKAPT